MKPLFDMLTRTARSLKRTKVKIPVHAWKCLDWWYARFRGQQTPFVRKFEAKDGSLDLWMHDSVDVRCPTDYIRTLTSDASLTGGGFCMGGQANPSQQAAFIFTNAQHNCSINWKELFTGMTELKSVDGSGNALTDQFVPVRSDNASTVAGSNKGYSQSASLNVLLQPLSGIQHKYRCQIKAAHIPGGEKKVADTAIICTACTWPKYLRFMQMQTAFRIFDEVIGVRCPNGHLPATAECTHRGLSYLWVPVPHTYTAAAKQARDWARFKLQYLTVLTVPIANNAAWWYSLKGAQQRLQFARTIQLFQFTPSYVCLQASIPQMQLPRLAMAPWAVVELSAGSKDGGRQEAPRVAKRKNGGRTDGK